MERRELIKKAVVAGGIAWTAPMLMSSAAVAAVCGSCTSGPSYQLLTANSGSFTGLPRACRDEANFTATVCRTSSTNTLKLAGNSAGTTAPAFDELAIITVTSPTAATFTWAVQFYQADCLAGQGATNTIVSPSGPVDISTMFNGECGNFSVQIRVRNAYSPFGWGNTFVVRS